MKTPENRETANKILNAALTLWAEKSYEQTTMRELARRLGMGVSSLYFYFRSKEEIVHYLYVDLDEQALAKFHEQDRGEKGLGLNVKRYLDIKLSLLAQHRSSLAAILREAVDPNSTLSPFSSDSSSVLGRNIGFFTELVERGGEGGDTTSIARLLWVSQIAVWLYWLHDRSAGFAYTRRLIDKVAMSTGLLPMVKSLPGAGELFELIGHVFTKETPAESVESIEAAASADANLREFDVIVIGGGPIGIMYASFLKQERPRTRILVLERLPEPGHKIGESTLSGFIKALEKTGISKDMMRQLFYPKNGLGFLHVDETVKDFTQADEYILETFDETYQVERRVLDSLMIANARRLGIQVIQGAQFQYKRSRLTAHGCVVSWQIGGQEFRARAHLVADASGPASVIAHELGMRTDDGLPFQTSSVWTYFSGVKPLDSYRGWRAQAQSPRDHYTQHFCFKEGWLWYIPIDSWQQTPTANLNQALDRLLRSGRTAPARADLIEEYSCPMTNILSVGISLRSDRDERIKDDPRAAFEHYCRKYPAIQKLLDGGKLLDGYYDPKETFMSRQRFRGYAKRMVGDGWLLIGDAAFFVDPLISPGLTGGTACAWHAAQSSVKALDAEIYSGEFLDGYQAFARRLHEGLERDNQLVYMSFNHPEAIAMVQRFQEIDARRHFIANRSGEYGENDTNVWGILDPQYQKMQKKLWALFREQEEAVGREAPIEEQSKADYQPLVDKLGDLLGDYIGSHSDLTPYVRKNSDRVRA